MEAYAALEGYLSCEQEIPEIMDLMVEARQAQIDAGRPQWPQGYPSRHIIEEDIARGCGRSLYFAQRIAGYAAVIPGDPGYEGIDLWQKVDGPWCSVHRLAILPAWTGHHFATQFMEMIIKDSRHRGFRELRFDTGEENLPMQALGQRLGFRCLGTAIFPWGPRLAYALKL